MKKLAISIPNYNRKNELNRLLQSIINQIKQSNLYEEVEICVSDDCSKEDPTDIIEKNCANNPQIDILYKRNDSNVGMDMNFMESVLMSQAEYSWIVGNDDELENEALVKVLRFLNKYSDVDFLVTPFDVYTEKNDYKFSVEPFVCEKDLFFDTSNTMERNELIFQIKHNSGVFGFLSNVIFKRKIWVERQEKYLDKMDSIFIQMYMDIDSLFCGAKYYYSKMKIIKNHADSITNDSIDRICKILIGIDGVIEYFFDGEERRYLKTILTDGYINGAVWNLSEDNEYYEKIKKIDSPKAELYSKYFIKEQNIVERLKNKCILVFGAGEYGKKTINLLEKYGLNVLGVADSDSQKIGTQFEGYDIISLREMINIESENKIVLVANHWNLVDMVNYLISQSVEDIGIIV